MPATFVAASIALTSWVAALTLSERFPLRPHLKEHSLRDRHWQDYVPRILAGEAVAIPIHPDGWTVTLPARP